MAERILKEQLHYPHSQLAKLSQMGKDYAQQMSMV